jgi:hypothetical protein
MTADFTIGIASIQVAASSLQREFIRLFQKAALHVFEGLRRPQAPILMYLMHSVL